VLTLLAAAIPLGAVVALLALALLDLIALITHLAYTGTISTTLGPPDTSVLGPLSVLVPVAGGLIVGLMARYGSERIRGHGIPEAMETILLRGSRMEPRLAVLKPISSAVSIGTGGPFGAEGPIIVTGGATGSILGQLLHLTAAERRCLLVAGAAAGMTAVFGTPVAAVLLAVELLLFEWRPRSMIPVALAACAAEATREALANAGFLHKAPLFAVSAHATLAPSVSGGALSVRRPGMGDDPLCLRRRGSVRTPAAALVLVARDRRPRGRHLRADRTPRARRWLQHDRRRARRYARTQHPRRTARRQAHDLGNCAWLQHQRWHPRTTSELPSAVYSAPSCRAPPRERGP
jgi:hypothetical protein